MVCNIEDKTPFWHRPQADPCRVLLNFATIPPWRRAVLDGDPTPEVWDRNDEKEHAFLLEWLNQNAAGWTTEIDIIKDGGYSNERTVDFEGTYYHAFIRFVSIEHTNTYKAWRDEILNSWKERQALVREGEDCCEECGGPIVLKSQTDDFNVRGILVRHNFNGSWCEHCNSSEGTPVNRELNRGFEFSILARNILNIPKGYYKSDDPVCAVIETNAEMTDEEFRTRILDLSEKVESV